MKYGLVRHFRIPHSQHRAVDSRGFAEWAEWYDTCEVKAGECRIEAAHWDLCYCSDLPRAAFTARTLFPGPIHETPHLREVPFAPLFASRIKIPILLWQALSRWGWRWAHASQPEYRAQTRERIRTFLAHAIATHPGKNILLVTHGFLMQLVQMELRSQGFEGKVPLRPFWGKVYVFTQRAGWGLPRT